MGVAGWCRTLMAVHDELVQCSECSRATWTEPLTSVTACMCHISESATDWESDHFVGWQKSQVIFLRVREYHQETSQECCSRLKVEVTSSKAVESAIARTCREGGARVSTNVFVRDSDLGQFNHLECRRLEVVADGLSLFGGAQLAIDTTLVSFAAGWHCKGMRKGRGRFRCARWEKFAWLHLNAVILVLSSHNVSHGSVALYPPRRHFPRDHRAEYDPTSITVWWAVNVRVSGTFRARLGQGGTFIEDVQLRNLKCAVNKIARPIELSWVSQTVRSIKSTCDFNNERCFWVLHSYITAWLTHHHHMLIAALFSLHAVSNMALCWRRLSFGIWRTVKSWLEFWTSGVRWANDTTKDCFPGSKRSRRLLSSTLAMSNFRIRAAYRKWMLECDFRSVFSFRLSGAETLCCIVWSLTFHSDRVTLGFMCLHHRAETFYWCCAGLVHCPRFAQYSPRRDTSQQTGTPSVCVERIWSSSATRTWRSFPCNSHMTFFFADPKALLSCARC